MSGQAATSSQARRDGPRSRALIAPEVERQLSLVDVVAAAVDGALPGVPCCAIPERAFAGELVPQDPSGEPASDLLERIAAERAMAAGDTGRRPRRRATMRAS